MSSAIMKNNTKWWGSFTLLSGLGATLVAGLLAWVFNTTLENKMTFTPVVQALDRLSKTVEEANEANKKREQQNAETHKLLVEKITDINSKMRVNEVKLFRVIDDCEKNGNQINGFKCKALMYPSTHTKDIK